MKVKIEGNFISIKKKLQKGETYKIQKGIKRDSINFYKKPILCVGFSSRTEDNKDIFLLDYDETLLSVVKEDISYLQGDQYMPPAYIFTTQMKNKYDDYIGNFHVIFLSKHTPSEILEIIKDTHCDRNFMDSPLRNIGRAWVLRLSHKNGKRKPKFLEIFIKKKERGEIRRRYVSDYPKISTAHKKMLSNFYPEIKHPKYRNEDGLKKIKLQIYETGA